MPQGRRSPWFVFTCAHCGIETSYKSTRTPAYKKKRYCSRRCWNLSTGILSTCKQCGAEFKGRPGSRYKWCSWKCYNVHRGAPVLKPCIQCGKLFTKRDRATTKKHRYCSRTCMWAWRRAHAKELKIRFYDRKQDRGRDWPQASNLCRELHEHQCQAPGCDLVRDERLNVDHIIPYRLLLRLMETDPHLKANDQRNLIPLCRVHHLRKSGAENKLFRGNVVGFIAEASRLIPKERILAALRLYGLIRRDFGPSGLPIAV